MKIRMRFIKRGPIQYIGHLDLMRYFQKVFRRCGLDVTYSQGYNPHQILIFASPLGVGLTSIGEYLDATINSLCVINEEEKTELTPDEWINRINEHSNDMVILTSFNILSDDAKPSMSLLQGATYAVSFNDTNTDDIAGYFKKNKQIIYTKKTKKSTKEINLKDGIYIVSSDRNEFYDKLNQIACTDSEYELNNIELVTDTNKKDILYIFCAAGSSLNIKPEMLIDAYCNDTNIQYDDYDVIRLDMYTQNEKEFISMSL